MTELIWDGKYVDGKKQLPVRVALPFQTIETVNESAADRQRTMELFASGRETEWRNRLIWGDKKYVLPSLLPEFAGRVDLIYVDPPFDTGADFSFKTTIPGSIESFVKEPSILEQKAYRDTWGKGLGSYIQWFYETAVLLHELLAECGSLYVHIGPNMSHYVKVVLDEVFGVDYYINEVVWRRAFGHSDSGRFGIIHDAILLYGKGTERTWNPGLQPPDTDYIETFFDQYDEKRRERYQRISLSALGLSGGGYDYTYKGVRTLWRCPIETLKKYDEEDRLHWPQKAGGVPRLKRYESEYEGMAIQDIWTDIKKIHNQSAELVNYPTQKPEALLERIVKTSSNESDLVLDCFVGSGTTAAVAEKLNRRWIACDLGRFAVHTARKRLLAIPGVKPFVVQNLGKYERQAWQSAEFPSNGTDHLAEQRQREAAYRQFILDLYHAKHLSGQTWLHGIKAGRMVHVGAVDAPVTIADVKAIAREVWKAASAAGGKAAVDVLGWEFAFELNETARNVAAESRVDVAFKKIPREVLEKKAVEQGDVKFFELGALAVDVKQNKREVTLKLSDFVIPLDDVPEEARTAIKHWSQMVDYWAVDWDFKEDTFHNQWQSYRTRKDPKIELQAKYTYAEAGKYRVVVKVIDILGNDTTKTLEIMIK
ncbi:MAG TPA: site-specific DNA-methyltransferase [Candidatus Angelobacter sp.]|nr:site-specific DNA-methyltransferase [Candidatus Angelobacter sp.]